MSRRITHDEFYTLADKNKYQVFLFICPGNIPFSFFTHSWFVINNRGSLSRWEILFRTMHVPTSWGHLYKDFFPIFQGIEIFPYLQLFFWTPRLLGVVEGDVAKQVIDFLEKSPSTYPECDRFVLSGPNSNTYVQWVLNHFPEFKVSLPWNAYGKNYRT